MSSNGIYLKTSRAVHLDQLNVLSAETLLELRLIKLVFFFNETIKYFIIALVRCFITLKPKLYPVMLIRYKSVE